MNRNELLYRYIIKLFNKVYKKVKNKGGYDMYLDKIFGLSGKTAVVTGAGRGIASISFVNAG